MSATRVAAQEFQVHPGFRAGSGQDGFCRPKKLWENVAPNSPENAVPVSRASWAIFDSSQWSPSANINRDRLQPCMCRPYCNAKRQTLFPTIPIGATLRYLHLPSPSSAGTHATYHPNTREAPLHRDVQHPASPGHPGSSDAVQRTACITRGPVLICNGPMPNAAPSGHDAPTSCSTTCSDL